MALVKRLGASYTVQTINNTDTITLSTTSVSGVIISGNLTILGNTTAVETTNTTLRDNIIVLNDGEVGAGVTAGNAGVLVNRGTLSNVSILWNEPVKRWQLTNDGTSFSNISITTGSGGTSLSAVADDTAPTLGGNLNTLHYQIWSSSNNVNIKSNIQLTNQSVVPTTVGTGNTIVYASTPSGGACGIYVVNSVVSNEELVTKRRAFGFSLIL